MLRRTLRLRAVMLAGLLLAALLAPAAANAWAIGGATIVYNVCSSTTSWKGDVKYVARTASTLTPDQTTGTASYCVNWYRINDADSTADYYMITARVNWATTHSWGGSDNASTIRLYSTIAAKGGSYEASPDYNVTYSGSCPTSTSVSVSAGFFSASVNLSELLCDSGRLTFVSAGTTQGVWKSTDVRKTPRWEVAYAVKVSQGQRPTLGIIWDMPCYQPKIIGTVPSAWSYDKAWCIKGSSHQV